MTNEYLSATTIAQASDCETKLYLNKKYGRQESDKERLRRERGNEEHLRHHVAAQRYGTPRGDSRCFIATEIYGPLSKETNILRNFRDTQLLPYAWGRTVVRCYYLVSPLLIPILHRKTWLRRTVRSVLNRIVSKVSW